MTEREGAILILPDGAILSELQDNEQLEQIREHATRCALHWCGFAKRDSLYLITAVYKSKSWTLGSFQNGSCGKEILVYRRPFDSPGTSCSTYEWQYQINVDDQQGPTSNSYVNQTVLIQGFQMTVRRGWLPVVEWGEWSDSWFTRALAKMFSAVLWQQWVTRTSKSCSCVMEYFSTRIMDSHRLHPISEFISGPCYYQFTVCAKTKVVPQPRHPLDIINRVLLEKVCMLDVEVYTN